MCFRPHKVCIFLIISSIPIDWPKKKCKYLSIDPKKGLSRPLATPHFNAHKPPTMCIPRKLSKIENGISDLDSVALHAAQICYANMPRPQFSCYYSHAHSNAHKPRKSNAHKPPKPVARTLTPTNRPKLWLYSFDAGIKILTEIMCFRPHKVCIFLIISSIPIDWPKKKLSIPIDWPKKSLPAPPKNRKYERGYFGNQR